MLPTLDIGDLENAKVIAAAEGKSGVDIFAESRMADDSNPTLFLGRSGIVAVTEEGEGEESREEASIELVYDEGGGYRVDN